MGTYPAEDIYEVWWHGPYRLEELEAKEPDFLETICLYAKYEDHPLYGRGVLTYIGKAVDQPITKRLRQHDLDREEVYVANVMRFKTWTASNKLAAKSGWNIHDFVKDSEIVSRIEELLIYALWPANNLRNKNSARKSWNFRLFNTGDIGSIPQELSGHYALENAPGLDGRPSSKK